MSQRETPEGVENVVNMNPIANNIMCEATSQIQRNSKLYYSISGITILLIIIQTFISFSVIYENYAVI